jgi:hypothetical protein
MGAHGPISIRAGPQPPRQHRGLLGGAGADQELRRRRANGKEFAEDFRLLLDIGWSEYADLPGATFATLNPGGDDGRQRKGRSDRPRFWQEPGQGPPPRWLLSGEAGDPCLLHRTEIGNIENGRRIPRVDTMIRIASWPAPAFVALLPSGSTRSRPSYRAGGLGQHAPQTPADLASPTTGWPRKPPSEIGRGVERGSPHCSSVLNILPALQGFSVFPPLEQ